MTRATSRPILFTAPMVRAILDGRKTQTRRIVKGIPFDHDAFEAFTPADPEGFWGFDGHNDPIWCVHSLYGEVGDRLWVRETAKATTSEEGIDCIHYIADDHCRSIMVSEYAAWKKMRSYGGRHARAVPSIHMPRWASRITLEINAIRIERLNNISEADAIAEGCQCAGVPASLTNVGAYAKLWDSINGDGSWKRNPWVWVIGFQVVKE